MRKIKGVGRRFAWTICKLLRIDVNRRAGTLNQKECEDIEKCMLHPEEYGMPEYLFNRKHDYKSGKYIHVVSNELDTRLREDLERMKKVK